VGGEERPTNRLGAPRSLALARHRPDLSPVCDGSAAKMARELSQMMSCSHYCQTPRDYNVGVVLGPLRAFTPWTGLGNCEERIMLFATPRLTLPLFAAGSIALLAATLPVVAQTYTTEFPATENPISEGGKWVQGGGTTGLDWTNARTSGGLAFGTQTGSGGYNDSISLLGGFSPNHRISGVIRLAGTRSSSTSTHEVELILRGNYTAHNQRLYECNLGYSGSAGFYSQIVRLDGPIGSFTVIGSGQPTPTVKEGDVFMAEINGNTIKSYLNGVPLQTATDSTISSGQPGIGFFWRGTENVNDFAFTSITVQDLNSPIPNPPSGLTSN
jgi:hypothetical protein